MDKSRVCVTRTINLAKHKGCKKQNLLVYDKSKDCPPITCHPVKPKPRLDVYGAAPTVTCHVKKIRVCTGADLKRMCPPKLCECPEPKSKSGSFLGLLGRVVGLGLKGALAAGLVYWTFNAGVWGTPDDTEKLYQDMCHTLVPVLCPESAVRGEDDDDDEDDELMEYDELCAARLQATCAYLPKPACEYCLKSPSIQSFTVKMREIYNRAVTNFFDLLANLPERLIEFKVWLTDRYYDLMESTDKQSCKSILKEKERRDNKC